MCSRNLTKIMEKVEILGQAMLSIVVMEHDLEGNQKAPKLLLSRLPRER